MSDDPSFLPYFKKCTQCRHVWIDRREFLSDPDISLIGYQENPRALTLGLLLFNHTCGTSLAIPVGRFRDLHQGPLFSESRRGTPECPGFCLHESNLEPCPVMCECAFVRSIMQTLKSWPKTRGNPISEIGGRVE